ncbi:MAG: hypothetical protein ACI9OI_001007, partial [Chitinophagales bacterium]
PMGIHQFFELSISAIRGKRMQCTQHQQHEAGNKSKSIHIKAHGCKSINVEYIISQNGERLNQLRTLT